VRAGVLRRVLSATTAVSVAALLSVGLRADSRAQALQRPDLGGVWTLNAGLSDVPPEPSEAGGGRDGGGERGGRDPGRGDGGRGRGRGGGLGGFAPGAGSGRPGGMGRAGGRGNPEGAARVRDAVRDIMEPPAHLTITQTESMVVLTGPDGRTTRLSPDGQKVKDENTKMERKTRWDGGKLVSDISGIGPGKITQTFTLDAERRRLRITVLMEGGGRSGQPRTSTRVYDADVR